eukprot:CAMPEP_0171461606 /NCGR_PEP_ID=MMETSP0945-20130129/5984_1 /TAXON_ID=109269 /ORGANISM="Vaucheria litorea, Strain CCMP2940" /LENGTH=129 /DNA_ID=CAMNT_0011987981 /DNA_START=295 /DNA_END=684 /DNA_ORIENTATION=+
MVPQISLADGSVSIATIQRARGIYGSRVLNLSDAVDKADFSTVASDKTAFTLLVSGGFSSKSEKKAAAELKKEIFAAIDAKDAASLKTAYANLVNLAKLEPTNVEGDTQGYSSDFDWKARTDKGTIYIR